MNNSIHYDLDLFCDTGIALIHYASAGGYIPEEIFSNPIHKRIRTHLLNSEELAFEYKLNPALDEILSMKYEAQSINKESFNREAYLLDFISYAKKGCFSFDRTFLSDPFDERYHLVAYPIFNKKYPLLLDENSLERIIRDNFNIPRKIFY